MYIGLFSTSEAIESNVSVFLQTVLVSDYSKSYFKIFLLSVEDGMEVFHLTEIQDVKGVYHLLC